MYLQTYANLVMYLEKSLEIIIKILSIETLYGKIEAADNKEHV